MPPELMEPVLPVQAMGKVVVVNGAGVDVESQEVGSPQKKGSGGVYDQIEDHGAGKRGKGKGARGMRLAR